MVKDLTEIVFVVDKSGSMSGLEDDTIGGFNSLIEKERKVKGEALVSLVLFDTGFKLIYDRLNIKDVKEMTGADYIPGGGTALYDAVGYAIHHIAYVHHILGENKPERTIFAIITDGYENSSRVYNLAHIKSAIEKEKNKYGWEFIFIGADITSEEIAEGLGIERSRAVNTHRDGRGIRNSFYAMEQAITQHRSNISLDERAWRESTDRDYTSRDTGEE